MNEYLGNVVERIVQKVGNGKHLVMKLKTEVIQPRYDSRLAFHEINVDKSISMLQNNDIPMQIQMEEYVVNGFKMAYRREGVKREYMMTIYLDRDSQALLDGMMEIKYGQIASDNTNLHIRNSHMKMRIKYLELPWYKKIFTKEYR